MDNRQRLIVCLLAPLVELGCPEWLAVAQEPPSWHLLGNSGTNSNSSFLGTTDNQQVIIKTDNIERLRSVCPAARRTRHLRQLGAL